MVGAAVGARFPLGNLANLLLEEKESPDLEQLRIQMNETFENCVRAEDWITFERESRFQLLHLEKTCSGINIDLAFETLLQYFKSFFPQISCPYQSDAAANHIENFFSFCEKIATPQVWYQKFEESSSASEVFTKCLIDSSVSLSRASVLFVIDRMIENTGCEKPLQDENLLVAVINLLESELGPDVSMAENCLVKYARNSQGAERLFQSKFQDIFHAVESKQSHSKFNVYGLMVKLCNTSEELCSYVSNSGWLDSLTGIDASSDDTLSQLTLMEVLCDLMESSWTIKRVHEAGIFIKLQNQLSSYHDQGRMDDPIAKGLMKVFSALALKMPQLITSEYQPSINLMLLTIRDSENDLTFLTTFETLVIVGMCSEGKKILATSDDQVMNACLKKLIFKLRNPPVENRLRYMVVLVKLFQAVPGDENSISDILEKWFSIMFPDESLSMFENILKFPFNELHLSCYEVLLSLVIFPWGVKMLCKCDGLLQLLLQRERESSKEGKELKYQVMQILMQSSSLVTEHMSEKTQEQIGDYLKKGALYVTPFNDDLELMGGR